MNFIAMDFETTGLDPIRNGPLSVGFHNNDIDYHAFMNPGNVEYSAGALAVNGFKYDEVYNWVVNPTMVDLTVHEILKPLADEHGPFVPIGFNVASFDMAFLKHWMPNTASLFSHRAFELNTLFMTLDMENCKAMKDEWTDFALADFGLSQDSLHDALVDAKVAWNIFSRYQTAKNEVAREHAEAAVA